MKYKYKVHTWEKVNRRTIPKVTSLVAVLPESIKGREAVGNYLASLHRDGVVTTIQEVKPGFFDRLFRGRSK